MYNIEDLYNVIFIYVYIGDISSFQPEDRRDWAKHLLLSATAEEREEEAARLAEAFAIDPVAAAAAASAAARWQGIGGGDKSHEYDDYLLRIGRYIVNYFASI